MAACALAHVEHVFFGRDTFELIKKGSVKLRDVFKNNKNSMNSIQGLVYCNQLVFKQCEGMK